MSKKILLAEDSTSYRIVLKSILQKDGYEVLEADSGQAAIDLASEQDDLGLLMLDYRLRDMTAADVLAELTEVDHLKTVPRIVISGESSMTHKKKVQELGVIGWFVKPCNLDLLRNLLKEKIFSGS